MKRSWLTLPFIGLVYLYKWCISPFIPSACRFLPTCSRYAIDAYHLHGVLKGSLLTARRVCRCHPWGGEGYDPVPTPQDTIR